MSDNEECGEQVTRDAQDEKYGNFNVAKVIKLH